MLRLLAFLTLLCAPFCRAEVPMLFREEHFSSATLAEAVNHYVAIGEDATVKELTELALAQKSDTNWLFCRGFSVEERMAWVCRILYEPNNGEPLRPPKFGDLSLPRRYLPLKEWPLYPVVHSGSSYFVLSQGYNSNGDKPETIQHYVDYCQKNGTFRKTPIAVPTRETALKDVAAILETKRWKNIQWENNTAFSYPLGDQMTYGYMQVQAKRIKN